MFILSFFFFNDTATTEIYTLSLHDALPISQKPRLQLRRHVADLVEKERAAFGLLEAPAPLLLRAGERTALMAEELDRKSTRLNSSHLVISYAVFCLKKKNTTDHLHMVEQHA